VLELALQLVGRHERGFTHFVSRAFVATNRLDLC
jgi:hypothetical protein